MEKKPVTILDLECFVYHYKSSYVKLKIRHPNKMLFYNYGKHERKTNLGNQKEQIHVRC